MIEGKEEVMKFIDDFYDRFGENTKESIKILRDQFMSGYCWHFAKILQSTFERGKVCWVKENSHIVWLDDDLRSYDIGGLYNDYNRGADINELICEDQIKPYIKSFKHVYTSDSDQFFTKKDIEESEEYFKKVSIKK